MSEFQQCALLSGCDVAFTGLIREYAAIAAARHMKPGAASYTTLLRNVSGRVSGEGRERINETEDFSDGCAELYGGALRALGAGE